MSGHTPGPWRLDIANGRIRTGDGLEVARMRATCVTYQWESDARLIAAAPDLLEALQALTSEVLAITDQTDAGRLEAIERLHKHGDAIEAARAALAPFTEREAR